MKPHIRKRFAGWECIRNNWVGYGLTPKAAYVALIEAGY